MASKLFAFASVTALTGLVSAVSAAGCSSSESTSKPVDAGEDVKAPREAGPRPVPEEAPPEPTCMTTEPIDATKFPYKNALPPQVGACTNDELKAIGAFYKEKAAADADIVISEWKGAVSEKCADCAFADIDGETWAPILAKNDVLENVDRGGCIAALSGKESCGRAYQQANECRFDACFQNCKTDSEFATCLQDMETIYAGPCAAAYDTLTKECGNNLGAYENGCAGTTYTFEGPIKVMCIGRKAADAGAKDGGAT